jgi:hypothetical protein
MEKRFADAAKDFQSPCGYFYEANGPDFGYTLGTHHNNVHVTWFYLHDTPIGDGIIAADAKWNQWLSYNLLRQPDGSTFVANRGVETRQQHAAFDREDGNLAEKVPGARAFATSKEERQRNIAEARKKLAQEWGSEKLTRSSGLPAGGSSPFSPYVFLQRRMPDYLPSEKERDGAIAKLPYLARDRFNHQRVDSRMKTTPMRATFTYIRRPAYYAIINSGTHNTTQQRLGLGLLWTPKDGTLLQTQTNSADHAWGTRADKAERVYEAADLPADFFIDGKEIHPEAGNHDLPGGEGAGGLVVTYPIGDNGGSKTLIFDDDSIEVRIKHKGAFVEQLPFLVNSHALEPARSALAPDTVIVGKLTVALPTDTKTTCTEGPVVFGDKRVRTLNIPASEGLSYTLRLAR